MKGSSPAKEKNSSLAVTDQIIWKNHSKIKGKGNSWEMGSIFIIYFAFAALDQILFQPITGQSIIV
jgi:hypothetical protein